MKLNKNMLTPGTVVHCPQEWQAQLLIDTVGWYDNTSLLLWDEYSINTCYLINDNGQIVSYGNWSSFQISHNIIDFDDLLIKPSPSLSAKDFFQIHKGICDSNDTCIACPLYYACLREYPDISIEEMLKICEKNAIVTVQLNLSNPREREIYEEFKHVQN